MRTDSQKLGLLLRDERLTEHQEEVIAMWIKHLKVFKTDAQILGMAYTIREFGLFIKNPYEDAAPEDLEHYLNFKRESNETITNNRVLKVKKSSVMGYRYRVNLFYRWIMKYTDLSVNSELAYPKPKVIKKPEKSREFLCKQRVMALLNNEIITTNRKADRSLSKEELRSKYPHLILDRDNLKTLNDYLDYKIASGKVESYTGFVSKLYFLKRLGLYLKEINKTFKEAKMEDIQGFLSEVARSISSKREADEKVKINISYKAHLLDFYRFVYGFFGEEQPRTYPPVVSWLYQKRKKSHDKLRKQILSDKEIKAMIDCCGETRDKALIGLIADCSARVGEIINTNIKDLRINEISLEGAEYSHSIATIVLRGKTGERTNQLFYSVPHLRLWLLNHPIKEDPEAPLFVSTKESRYGQRLTPVGINKILQRAARKAGVTRHIHAHLFRHTNLTRMARILSESELKIHAGWGEESNMASVYVHLDEKDVANKILENYGLKPKEKEEKDCLLEIGICPNTLCNYGNPSEAKFCLKCGYPLTLKTAVSLTKIKQKEDELQRELFNKNISTAPYSGDIKEAMYQVLKSDPHLIAKLKELMDLSAPD